MKPFRLSFDHSFSLGIFDISIIGSAKMRLFDIMKMLAVTLLFDVYMFTMNGFSCTSLPWCAYYYECMNQVMSASAATLHVNVQRPAR